MFKEKIRKVKEEGVKKNFSNINCENLDTYLF